MLLTEVQWDFIASFWNFGVELNFMLYYTILRSLKNYSFKGGRGGCRRAFEEEAWSERDFQSLNMFSHTCEEQLIL